MTRDEVLGRLTAILSRDFRIPPERVKTDASFRGTLGMDSLDAVDLVYLICKDLGLKPDLHPFRDLHTVDKVVTHLTAELAKKAGAGGP